MILIVDDRPENIFSLKSTLELHSFAVDTASGGEEALRKTLKNNYSLIILDVQMPGMDGFETAEFLAGNKTTKDIPLIFLSAVNTDKKFITKGYASGAIDYIVKPIDPDILLMKVRTFDRLYRQNRELNAMQQELQKEIVFRKKAQQEIQNKARELHGILSAIPQVAFTATANGDIDFVNDHWPAYSNSLDSFPLVHPDDSHIMNNWKALIQEGKPIQLELRIAKLETQEFRYHLLRVIPVMEEQVLKWVGTFTDIEEQKQAIKRKDEFLSIASHELKTPLTSIKGYVQLLEKLIPGETTRLYFNRTLAQIAKLEDLVNDILDVSKIENGKLTFALTDINFEALLQRTLEMLEHIFPRIIIIRKQRAAESLIVRGNTLRLEQVIINFISNAFKYSPENKEIEIITRLTEKGELYFGVQDQGIGIDIKSQAHVFNKFYRVSEASKYAQGLGIGLYICAEMLKRHGADFGVVSEPGKGSLFYFILPVINNISQTF
ncbi:MAG: response regulator [Agriterribacter sp.]